MKHEYTINTKTPEAEAKFVIGLKTLVSMAKRDGWDTTESARSILAAMYHDNMVSMDGKKFDLAFAAIPAIVQIEMD